LLSNKIEIYICDSIFLTNLVVMSVYPQLYLVYNVYITNKKWQKIKKNVVSKKQTWSIIYLLVCFVFHILFALNGIRLLVQCTGSFAFIQLVVTRTLEFKIQRCELKACVLHVHLVCLYFRFQCLFAMCLWNCFW
jgi:hypothetical protein